MNKTIKTQVYLRTNGKCHFCGEDLVFESYGLKKKNADDEFEKGSWEIDHVVPRANGGKDNIENLLPACKACNGLRWFRKGTAIHRIMLLGILAVEEIDKKSDVGSKMDSIYAKRKKTNVERRLKRLLSKSQS